MSIVRPIRLGALAGILFLASCSSSDPVAEVSPSSTTAAPQITTTTGEQQVSTTIQLVPASEFGSAGTIAIGPTEYAFAFECYAAGAGDILALGVGTDPTTGSKTQAVVQAFLGQTYVAVVVDDDEVQELAIDQPAELFVQGDAIRGSALRFVAADESPGVGESLGLGTVAVDCQGFAPGLPEGYVIS